MSGVVEIIGASSKGGSGGKYFGGVLLSDGATTEDAKARYPTIQKTTSGSQQELFSITSKLPQGTYSVMIRLKASDITNTENVVSISARVNNATGTLLKEIKIKPSALRSNNEFQTLGFIVDFNAAKEDVLCLSATLLQCSASVTVTIDYVLIAPAFTAISSIS